MCNIGIFESLCLKQRVLFGQPYPTSRVFWFISGWSFKIHRG